MAEEFQAEVCGGGTWWSSPRATFNSSSFITSNYGGGGCWQNDYMNLKTKSTDDSSGGYATAVISPDSTCQIITSSPSSTTNWYQALLGQTLPENLNNLPDGSQNSSDFGMDQEQTSNYMTNSGDCTGNLVNNTSYGYPLLQTLFNGTSSPPPSAAAAQPQQPIYDFQANLSNFDDGLHLTNKTFFWNTSAYEEKLNKSPPNEEILDMGSSVKKSYVESTFKRPRLETPSPLPTFKVRKEKLGDRVTALQQLVSPFGKTDTASVLHEAIEYIKLLQDQVNVLSSPYMRNDATMQVQQINNKGEEENEGAKQQNLTSRGLCLVPVSSTFPVAVETTPDYWTSGLRGTFN